MLESSKQCFKCRETKPLSDFYKHSRMADGHLNKCKKCTKSDVKENREMNIEHYSQYEIERSKDRTSPRIEGRRQRLMAKTRSKAKNPGYPMTDPEIAKMATTSLSNGIRDGYVDKYENCQCCGGTSHVQGHHSSYDEDMWRVVTWLCSACHKKLHTDFEYNTGPFKNEVYVGFR